MNSHLNIFNTYSKESRQFQLENDLTRALAICMQENSLFFNEILMVILDETDYFDQFFNNIETSNEIAVTIQHNSANITGFDKIFAVSLSEWPMQVDQFWNQSHQEIKDPICDIVIRINQIVIIIEAKRDNVDCTAQLYNQTFNICQKNNIPIDKMKDTVRPVDLNWPKLMEKAIKVRSFETAIGTHNRFLKDFIDLVKKHNFTWLPEPAICSVFPDNKRAILRRIESAINEICNSDSYKKLEYNDRLGLYFDQPWAQEVLFKVTDEGNLVISIYPGNTKAQGMHIFGHDPQLNSTVLLINKQYDVSVLYHINFTSFQKYFAGLWFSEDDLDKPLYTQENFWKYCGRKKRGPDWNEVESLFNDCFKPTYEWKEKCFWESKIIKSGKSQFDLSFGYELNIEIPFKELKKVDQSKSDLSGLSQLIKAAYIAFKSIYKK